MSTQTAERFTRFADFYPFYLAEHSNPTCRRLHYIGSLLVLAILAYAVTNQQWLWLLAMPLAGYGFAWVGHFIFEKNRPATFQYPPAVWRSGGDLVMIAEPAPTDALSPPTAHSRAPVSFRDRNHNVNRDR